MNGLTKFLASNNLNRSNSMHVSRSNETTLDPKIAEILDASLRQNGFVKPKKQEPEKVENMNPPHFGQPKSPAVMSQPRDILEEEIFEECSKAIAILNKYRFKQEPEANQRRNHPSMSHFSRETEATTKEEPKSYKQLWKEGKDLREFARDKNALYAIIYENELLGNNTYLRQHLNRRIRGSSAALIIQRWFRDHNRQKGDKKSFSPQHPKQEWIGLLSTKGNLDSKIKKRQARRDLSRSRNPSCYEYEELETENGSLPMRNNHSGQKKILEEVSIQLKGNLGSHSGKKLSATKKNKLDKENFSLEREELENNTTPKKNLDLPLKRTSPVRVNKKKGILKVDSTSYKESEKAVVKIQRALRKYLFNKNRSSSFERENASAELVKSQQENEKLQEIILELENNIEKRIEERVGIEKARFKELLDQYTQFIDKLLQEKVDITQYYEIITASNQEMKLKLKTFEEKDYENIISNLQLQNQKLLDEKSQILKDLQNAQENNQQSLLKEVVQTLEEENETLKNKLHDFQSELQKYINEKEKAHETNSLLLQKLRSSEVRISELAEKLEISENKCRGLLEMAKSSLYNPSPTPLPVENLKSRIYIPRVLPENIPPGAENFINQFQQSQRNDYSPRKFDEDYILSVRNNTESETQSIAETHRDRDQKPALNFKLVESECDLLPDSGKISEQIHSDTDRLAPPETNQHLEFSFEAKDSSRQYENNNNAIIESFEVDPAVESNRIDEHIENKARETQQHVEKIFEYRKMSQEYFSGKFVDEMEEHYQDSLEDNHHHHHRHRIQEHVIDEEDQSLEINLLIENISKKLELAKLNRDNDNPNEEAVENAFREHIKFAKALSLPRFEETERSPLHQETNKMRNLSQKNLHQNGLLFEEEEEDVEIHEENPLHKEKQPNNNNIKKGILDTLKKADLLFGRANI